MKTTIVSPAQFLYADDVVKQEQHKISLISPRNSFAACQILVDGCEKGLPVIFGHYPKGPCSLALTVSRILPVHVELNCGQKMFCAKEGDQPEEYAAKVAPFLVYDAIGSLPQDAVTDEGVNVFWVSFSVPYDQRPGIYEGEISLAIDEWGCVFPYRVEVVAAQVPNRPRFSMTTWYNLVTIAQFHDVEFGSDRYFSVLKEYARLMARSRQNMFILSDQSFSSSGKLGDYRFDFSFTKRMNEVFLEAGLSRIELQPPIFRKGWESDEFFINTPDNGHQNVLKPLGYAYLAELLKAFANFFRENGWYDKVVCHVSDEPVEENSSSWRAISSIIRKFMPGVPIIEACQTPELLGAIDIWAPAADEFMKDYKMDAYDFIRKYTCDEKWFYVAGSPTGKYLNRMLDMELIRNRYIPWAAFRYGFTGYLHWGFNYVMNSKGGYFSPTLLPGDEVWPNGLPAGDSAIIYVKDKELMSSARLENLRLGVEEFELLAILAEHDRKLADSIAARNVQDFTNYNTNVQEFEKSRQELLRAVSIYF